jgi:1-acyl-sn-glycerol-3-phosphate acyltransferase
VTTPAPEPAAGEMSTTEAGRPEVSTPPASVADAPAAEPFPAEPGTVLDTAVEPVAAAVEAAPASLPTARLAKPAAPAAATQPVHRGAESTPYNDILHRTLKPPVRVLLNRLVMRIRLEGVENIPRDEPLIFAGNHSSWLDGPLVVIEAPRTIRCLAKVEMYKGILGWLLRLVGQIPIDRGKADRVALHTALDELARGNAIGVFPEGTRGSGEMAAVQHGIAYLAVHGRCRVLPVACLGTGDALPKGARWPKRSVQVRVVFGAPFAVEIPANPRSRKALAAVAEDIRVRLADHLSTARAGGAD